MTHLKVTKIQKIPNPLGPILIPPDLIPSLPRPIPMHYTIHYIF